MGIKVSIIMPSLNVADYIEEAVQSVRNQTLQEIEIICIDAGSDDGTWEILSRFAEIDKRIILYRSDRKSYGYQVNLGIDIARGEYIAVVETDDYVDSKMYERLYQEAVLNDCDCVKSDYFSYWTQENGERFFVRKKNFLNDHLYGIIIEPKLHWEIATYDWYLWTGIYKKEFLIQNNIRLSETPGAAFQDIGFLYQTNIKAKKVLYLKDCYYRYCMDRKDSSSNLGKGLLYSYQEYNNLYKRIKDGEINDLECIRLFYCRMAKSFICCYDEMEHMDVYISDKEKTQYYQWFQIRLKDAVNHGMISKQILHPKIWEKVKMLLISEDNYIEKARKHEEQIKLVIGEPGKYSVVIFGCGFYGYRAYQWLKKERYSIIAFIDNNTALWGTKIDKILIENPKQAEKWSIHTKYLIANEQYSEEMKKQLLSMGVQESNICVYV